MNGRKIPYSEAVRLWKDLKPSDIIVLPDGREIDIGAVRQVPIFCASSRKAEELSSGRTQAEIGVPYRSIVLYHQWSAVTSSLAFCCPCRLFAGLLPSAGPESLRANMFLRLKANMFL